MTLNFETEGVIYKIEPIQQINETFKKRNIVIMAYDNPMYKEYPIFDLVQDDCNLVDGMSEGDRVSILFNIKGREYQDKNTGEVRFFNSLRAWKITKIDKATANNESSSSSNDEDLPF